MKKEYLTEREVYELTGRALSTLRNDRQADNGFPYVKWGRFVRYRKKDIIEFMESRQSFLRMVGIKMTEKEILKRKIQLNGQHLKLIKAERRELIYKLALMGLKETLEAQIKKKFDPILSRKLDCINYLLENWK